MKECTGSEVINKLTNCSIDFDSWGGVASMIKYECKGYVNFTDQELIEEWRFFFEEVVKIKDSKEFLQNS